MGEEPNVKDRSESHWINVVALSCWAKYKFILGVEGTGENQGEEKAIETTAVSNIETFTVLSLASIDELSSLTPCEEPLIHNTDPLW